MSKANPLHVIPIAGIEFRGENLGWSNYLRLESSIPFQYWHEFNWAYLAEMHFKAKRKNIWPWARHFWRGVGDSYNYYGLKPALMNKFCNFVNKEIPEGGLVGLLCHSQGTVLGIEAQQEYERRYPGRVKWDFIILCGSPVGYIQGVTIPDNLGTGVFNVRGLFDPISIALERDYHFVVERTYFCGHRKTLKYGSRILKAITEGEYSHA